MEHLWKLEKAFMKDLLKHLEFTKKNDW
jgi:hypothetical protein